eukprot:5278201-Lingulodinium_polyedra.AAC.1
MKGEWANALAAPAAAKPRPKAQAKSKANASTDSASSSSGTHPPGPKRDFYDWAAKTKELIKKKVDIAIDATTMYEMQCDKP